MNLSLQLSPRSYRPNSLQSASVKFGEGQKPEASESPDLPPNDPPQKPFSFLKYVKSAVLALPVAAAFMFVGIKAADYLGDGKMDGKLAFMEADRTFKGVFLSVLPAALGWGAATEACRYIRKKGQE